MKSHIPHRAAACLATGLTLAATPAIAQVAGPDQDVVAIDDIIVTALHRDGTVQDTAASLTAVDGQALEATGRNSLGALRAVPGVVAVEAGPGNIRMVMRGLQSVGEPLVGVYYDDAPVTGVVGTQNDAGGTTPGLRLFDVDRIEVLRGPQGTLYGSGAAAGAVKIFFNRPAPVFDASLAVEAGFGSGRTDTAVEAMVNLPVNDTVAVRLAGFSQQLGGWIDNPELREEGVNDTQASGGRLLVSIDPSTRLHISGEAHFQTIEGDRMFWTLEQGPYRTNSRVRLPSADEVTLYTLNVEYELDGMIASAIVSHQDRTIDQASGDPSFFFQALINDPATCARLRGGGMPCSAGVQADFNAYISNYVYGQLISFSDISATNAELRLASKGDQRLNWTVGAYVSTRDSDIDNNQFRADPLTGAAVEPLDVQTRRLIRDELGQSAVFGEASLELMRSLTLTVGGRYYDYDRRVGGATVVPLDLINNRLSTWTEVKSREDGWVGRVNLAYSPDSQTLIYGQAAQGFRPGGVNQVIGLPAELGPYASDRLSSYEFGAKRQWFNRSLTTNLSIYRVDWEDMQVSGMTTSGPFSFISNAGAARVEGAEVEIVARPTDSFNIKLGASYVDAVLSEDQLNANITANGRAGDRIPFVPKITWNADFNYERPIGDGLNATVTATVGYVGESFSEFRPTSPYYRRLPDYTLVRLQIGLLPSSDQWGAYFFVDNATDEVAITSLYANGFSRGQTITTSLPPRRAGFRLERHF